MPRCVNLPIDDLLIGLNAGDFDDEEVTLEPRLACEKLNAPVKGRRIDPANAGAMSVGFSTARGSAISPPSEAALKRARILVETSDAAHELLDSPSNLKRSRVGDDMALKCRFGSTAARSNPRNPPHSPSPPVMRQLIPSSSTSPVVNPVASFNKFCETDLGGPSCFPASLPTGETELGFRLGSGKAAPLPTQSSLSRALAIFSDLEDSATRSSRSPASTKPANVAFQTPTRTISVLRRPLEVTTNINSTGATSSGGKPIAIRTPTAPRRMGIDGSHKGLRQRGFVSPFLSKSMLAESQKTHAIRALPKTYPTRPVFDLHPLGPRQTILQAYLHPQYYTLDDLRALGMWVCQPEIALTESPSDVLHMTIDNAIAYRFQMPISAGRNDALRILQRDGCSCVTPRWVDNHWTLILWKLAGMTQAKPSLIEELWSFKEVVRQLKYRYEREFGEAQRPILRRIQEHDSSPSVPMVLCVVRICSPKSSETATVQSLLELTDGWYRIYAEVDECLGRAIRRGRLRPGQKLAISGARLDSTNDGTEALDAVNQSKLVLSANSCALARWHVRLGVHCEPFVAGLSSLTADGGVIMLMDIVIDKIYPLAFLYSEKSQHDVWNADEEARRAGAWEEKYLAESARLRQGVQERLERYEDIFGMLSRAAGDCDGSTARDLSDELDALLAANDPRSRIQRMAPTLASQLAIEARERMQAEMASAQSEIEAELQSICPPRRVRDFRMVRIRDARVGQKDSHRLGMLNVWDAASLGDTFKEQGRYLVRYPKLLWLTVGLQSGSLAQWGLVFVEGAIYERGVSSHAK
ncbi:BRCA2, oligonucleotide/oligosaccharide-binding, domain 1-domain-containing protein [Naematelia encephala]|uniref:BRCA2, oligonucleotide/oligosaccharide-binding, domain 1-domain-containing protein n=1 Tax=Naematelia encephala TaxID=71784 RepID=A0A1Y2BJ18_9TREE|nr:BRCA2, oligonucleotide/oligosaccharide-binding, domain 1-domain-containing protein [Naematelia encephala]